MPKGSKWLEWRRALFHGKSVADYVVDENGAFHCDHGCGSLDEHEARAKFTQMRFAGDLQRLELRPGDVLVLSSSERLVPAQREFLRGAMARQFPRHKCVILEGGMRLAAVSSEAAT